jgi:hypothetical protein
MKRIILIVALLSLLASPSWATVYWISPSGNDSNGCTSVDSTSTSVDPGVYKASVASAYGCLTSGSTDILHAKAGTYSVANSQLNSPSPVKSGISNTQRLTIEGEGVGVTIFQRATWFWGNVTHRFVTFKDFSMDGQSTAAGFMPGFNGCSDIIIQRVHIHHNDGNHGLHGKCDLMIVRDSELNNNGQTGTNQVHNIYDSGDDNTFINVYVHDAVGGYGIQCYGGNDGAPIQADRCKIHNSRVQNNANGGIVLDGNGSEVRRSLVTGNGSNGGIVCGYTEGASGCINALFDNNVVYNNSGHGIDIGKFGGGTSSTARNKLVIANGGTEINVNGGVTGVTLSNNACTAGESCGATGKLTIAAITDCTVSTSDFTHKSGSSCINQGVAISGLLANGLPDIGAFESISTPTTAVASGNVVDVTMPMSLNVPIAPATGQTTWVVKFSGVARTTVSAGKLSPTDTVVRIQYDGAACSGSDTMTVDFTSGNVTDSANIGGTLTQKVFSFTGLAVDESGCGGTPPDPPSGPYIVYHLNDGSGTDVDDSSGNDNHGTTSGSPAWVTGSLDGALDFAAGVDDQINVPFGSGVDPTSQSVTACILVAPDSPSTTDIYMGVPLGSGQRGYLGIVDGTWSIGIQNSPFTANSDFPVQDGYSFPCIVWDAVTDKASLWVNAVKGTTENGTNGASIKPYTSHTFAGNFTVGKANGFGDEPGGVIDEVFFYQTALEQSDMTDLYQSLIPPPPPSTGTRKQNGRQFQRPYKKAGAPENLRPVNEDAQVVQGGAVDVILQIDCTGNDCDDFGPRLYRSIDGGGTYAQVNDTCGVVCFRGSASSSDLVTEGVDECLSGALTDVPGPTNVTSAAVPNVSLSEDHCTVIRFKLRLGSEATVGQEIYLKLFDQNGNEFEDSAVPALGAKITVKEVGNGAGR